MKIIEQIGGDSMLKVEHLTKKFGETVAVDDISFTANSGEVIGLLGPNGAGKSTTIKAIAGLLRKNKGKIYINGLSNDTLEAKLQFSYIPEVPDLYDYITAWEHLKFVAGLYSIKDWESKGEEIFNRFDLLDKKDKLAKELSKGMKQKVSICTGLITNPKVLMFDEPMIGLDPKAIRETKKLFRELADTGKTVFVSTHLLDTIETMCDKVLVMKNGKIIADATVSELRILFEGKGDTLEEIFLEVTKDE
jgi:ABC-type multidrug transport system ATPase subunit